MIVNPNSPAMPEIVTDFAYKTNREYLNTHSKGGMTVRAELAARMQSALIAKYGSQYDRYGDWHAKIAVDAADALINELNKTEND